MCDWKNGTRYRNWEKQPCFFSYFLWLFFGKKISPHVFISIFICSVVFYGRRELKGAKTGEGRRGGGRGKRIGKGREGGRLFMFVLLLLAYSSYAQVFISYMRMTLFRFPLLCTSIHQLYEDDFVSFSFVMHKYFLLWVTINRARGLKVVINLKPPNIEANCRMPLAICALSPYIQFIYSSLSNTILLLKAYVYSSLCFLLYHLTLHGFCSLDIPHLRCCLLITMGYLNMCSVEIPVTYIIAKYSEIC